MSKIADLAGSKEQAGDTSTIHIYRARSVNAEVLIAMPKDTSGKVFARIFGKDGSVTFLPVAPVKGEKVQE
jgi:hypothetical protein